MKTEGCSALSGIVGLFLNMQDLKFRIMSSKAKHTSEQNVWGHFPCVAFSCILKRAQSIFQFAVETAFFCFNLCLVGSVYEKQGTPFYLCLLPFPSRQHWATSRRLVPLRARCQLSQCKSSLLPMSVLSKITDSLVGHRVQSSISPSRFTCLWSGASPQHGGLCRMSRREHKDEAAGGNILLYVSGNNMIIPPST